MEKALNKTRLIIRSLNEIYENKKIKENNDIYLDKKHVVVRIRKWKIKKYLKRKINATEMDAFRLANKILKLAKIGNKILKEKPSLTV